MVLKLYRNIVPLAFREKMYDLLVGDVVFFFRHFSVIARAKLNHWLGFAFPQTEENRAMAFIGKYGITSYPHPHMLEYKNLSFTKAENYISPKAIRQKRLQKIIEH
jgi:hypothetical protein